MTGHDGGGSVTKQCGVFELVLFIIAIITGTACSICSKTMMNLRAVGIDGKVETFEKPIFQTFGMFVGMMFGLVMHWIVLWFKLPFPGYEHGMEPPATVLPVRVDAASEKDSLLGGVKNLLSPKDKDTAKHNQPPGMETSAHVTPVWMYFFLAIPSIFDLAATALCMMGLRYLDVSIYQLLRGSGIIFVALMKQNVLGDRLYKFQWIGVVWNVVSVMLVGATAVLNGGDDSIDEDTGMTRGAGEAFLGVVLVMSGAFVQALQFVFEEKVMTMEEAAAPPLLLIGMEGLWGSVLCLLVVYPIVYFLPGKDHGSYEDPFNTYTMFWNSPTIQWAFVIYFFAIFAYNLFAVMVTFMLNSVWHAILDNFRPITVWGTDMFIFYIITRGTFGEPWTKYSYIQLFGMAVLLYGTSIYNAPNPGSIRLLGKWWHLGINLSEEYKAVDIEIQEAEEKRLWDERKQNFKAKKHSSLAERSPYISIHTQSLRGLASPRI